VYQNPTLKPKSTENNYYYYYYIRLVAFFQDNLGKPAPESKPFWILLEQEMMWWQWHQLDHMQIICSSLQTETPVPDSVFTDWMPFLPPTNIVKALKAIGNLLKIDCF